MLSSSQSVITLLTLLLSSTVLGAAATVSLNNLRAASEVRRLRYAEVVQSIGAWVEYPYRIRRRVDNAPATLSELAGQGHSLQERLALNRAWVAAESRAVSAVLEDCLNSLAGEVGASCQDAWRTEPVSRADQMNLGDFGPRGYGYILAKLQLAISYRFGVRRLLWASVVQRRIERQYLAGIRAKADRADAAIDS